MKLYVNGRGWYMGSGRPEEGPRYTQSKDGAKPFTLEQAYTDHVIYDILVPLERMGLVWWWVI